jgi:hypothetical protein
MATFEKGFLHTFSGTIGPVVGSSWRGKPNMRSLPKPRSYTSQAQLEQQARFGKVMEFLYPFKHLIKFTYQEVSAGMTPMNSAVSFILRNALIGTYPNFSIDHASVLIARGSLPGASLPSASAAGSGCIHFSWGDNSGIGSAKPRDRAVLVAYCGAEKSSAYFLEGLFRNTGSGILSCESWRGKTVHTWMAFLSANGRYVSPSTYTGALQVI